ncbi:MAG: alpha/beta fold hydrolase [Xenococcaceae cyanobacterium MO_188.B32]|nr:alpha/beta fold hydrolase [Xenococcaceae cyanobacterium MO_188.B32]
MSITEQTIKIGDLEWFYREGLTPTSNAEADTPPQVEGGRKNVLLLHGLPSHSFGWYEVMEKLARSGFNTIAPDWIGSGFSAKPDKRDFAYTPEAFITALTDFVEASKLENFHLVVQGFLGSIGLQYAFRHPQKIQSLVILNTPLSTEAKLPWKMKQWGIPFVGDMLTQDPLLVDRTLEGGSGFVISDENLAVYRKPFLMSSSVGRALVATIQKLKLEQTMAEIEAGFANWDKPTLLIWGMADPWLAATQAEKLAASNSNVKIFKLPEAKHYPQEHWAKEISEKIIQFFPR